MRSPLSAVDGEALGYVGYFAELIDEWAQEADPNETLFRLGASMVEAMAAGVPIEPLARYFEYWLLRLQGVYPPHVAVVDAARRSTRRAVRPVRAGGTCSRVATRGTRRGEARGMRLSPRRWGFCDVGAGVAAAVGDGARGSRGPRTRSGAPVADALHLEKELRSTRVLRDLRGDSTSPMRRS